MRITANHQHLSLLLLLLLLATAHSQSNTTNFSYSFPSFDSNDNSSVLVLRDSNINLAAVQLTPDTINYREYFANKSGRVFIKKPFKLWGHLAGSNVSSTATTKHVASFNTSFSINIVRANGSVPGEGFAFLIAPSPDSPPPGSIGRFLGLTNASTDGNSSNYLIAVELDTVKQSYDPDDNHIGLDINGVASHTAVSLTPFNIEICPVNMTRYTVWIDYSGVARHIWVYMALQGNPKPNFTVLNTSLDISDHVQEWSYLGFSASTGTTYQLNCLVDWNLTVEALPDDLQDGRSSSRRRQKLYPCVGLILGAVVATAVIFGLFYIRRRRRRDGDNPRVLMDALNSLPGMPREFKFSTLKKATNNFDKKLKLGEGGFGEVYKGLLPGQNVTVAVKKFSRDKTNGQDDFLAELTIINRLRHKNLVPLIGWCHKKGMLLLVYEFMPNGSLDQHLRGGPGRPLLSWERRYNILAGVASALRYLHHEYNQMVVHRDIKCSNVMLDSAFDARLGDFGLARAVNTDKNSYTDLNVAGTCGYIAVECLINYKFTRESDVYAFGTVVLVVVCGRGPILPNFEPIVEWVWNLHGEGRILDAVDPRIAGEYVREEAERLLLLGLACCHPIPGERPKTQVIGQIISKSAAPPEVPLIKPALVFPALVPKRQLDSEDTSSAWSSTAASSSLLSGSSA